MKRELNDLLRPKIFLSDFLIKKKQKNNPPPEKIDLHAHKYTYIIFVKSNETNLKFFYQHDLL